MVIAENRPTEEIEAWNARDPIDRFAARLKEQNIMTQDDVDRLAAEVETSLAEAVKYALDAPYPDPETVAEGLWAD